MTRNTRRTANDRQSDAEATDSEGEQVPPEFNISNLVQVLAQALRAAAPQTANQQAGNGNNLVAEFRGMAPPTLKGDEGPLGAEEWIRKMERIFNYMRCRDDLKVTCAVFQLEDEAGHWWELETSTLTDAQRRAITWKTFKEKLLAKYFPKAFRKQKEMELMNLTQGDMKILEYERKFTQLARYAPHLVDTDEKKAWRFENGLRDEIGGHLAALNITSYSEILQRAQAVASRLKLEDPTAKPLEVNGKKRSNDQRNQENTRPEKRSRSNGENNQNFAPSKPFCPKCTKYHFGQCVAGENACFRCHQAGHMASHCPNGSNFNNNKAGGERNFNNNNHGGRNFNNDSNGRNENNNTRNNNIERKGNARVFAMNQEEPNEE